VCSSDLLGSLAAGMVSNTGLRWSYVFYLTVLEILLLARNPLKSSDMSPGRGIFSEIRWLPLSLVGLIAGAWQLPSDSAGY
jgi:hypothetical protein